MITLIYSSGHHADPLPQSLALNPVKRFIAIWKDAIIVMETRKESR